MSVAVDVGIQTTVTVDLTIADGTVLFTFLGGVDASEHETDIISLGEVVLTHGVASGYAVAPVDQGKGCFTFDLVVDHLVRIDDGGV